MSLSIWALSALSLLHNMGTEMKQMTTVNVLSATEMMPTMWPSVTAKRKNSLSRRRENLVKRTLTVAVVVVSPLRFERLRLAHSKRLEDGSEARESSHHLDRLGRR
jgi:hypothetical protein